MLLKVFKWNFDCTIESTRNNCKKLNNFEVSTIIFTLFLFSRGRTLSIVEHFSHFFQHLTNWKKTVWLIEKRFQFISYHERHTPQILNRKKTTFPQKLYASANLEVYHAAEDQFANIIRENSLTQAPYPEKKSKNSTYKKKSKNSFSKKISISKYTATKKGKSSFIEDLKASFLFIFHVSELYEF